MHDATAHSPSLKMASTDKCIKTEDESSLDEPIDNIDEPERQELDDEEQAESAPMEAEHISIPGTGRYSH